MQWNPGISRDDIGSHIFHLARVNPYWSLEDRGYTSQIRSIIVADLIHLRTYDKKVFVS
jgi:hypothetical protein